MIKKQLIGYIRKDILIRNPYYALMQHYFTDISHLDKKWRGKFIRVCIDIKEMKKKCRIKSRAV